MKTIRNEKGTVLVFAVLFMTMSLLFMALIFDMGSAWLARAKLQNVVDAATLAAIQEKSVKVDYRLVPRDTVTEVFTPGQEIPPRDIIVDIVPETESHWVVEEEIDPVTGKPVIDPLTGAPKIIKYQEEMPTGNWIITYYTTWDEVVVGKKPLLRTTDAEMQAAKVLNLNLKNDAILRDAVITNITQGQSVSSSHSIGYEMTIEAEIPSYLLGPVLRLVTGQDVGRPTLKIRAKSESRAYLLP